MNILNSAPQHHIEVGGFIIDLYFKEGKIKKSYMEIKTLSGIFSMRIDARTHPFGYLWAAASQGKETQLHGYAAMMYRTAMALTQSQGFVDGLTKEINKLDKRLLKKAEKAASEVSEYQDQASAALMEDIASESGMSKKELKEKREADKELMREVLNEDADKSAEQEQNKEGENGE